MTTFQVGSKCEIYTNGIWYDGEIIEIINDKTGIWFKIKYDDDKIIIQSNIIEPMTKTIKKTLLKYGICGAGGAVAIGTATVALPLIGFSSGGVVAGSLAASTQSMIGNIAAGSLFASLQSAGVIGMATSTKAIIGITGAVITKKVYPSDEF